MRIRPIHGEPTRWTVQSEHRPGIAFIVDSDWEETAPDGSRWACGCEHFMVRGRECKHIRAVRQSLTRAIRRNGIQLLRRLD